MEDLMYVYQLTLAGGGKNAISYRSESAPLEEKVLDSFRLGGFEVQLMVFAAHGEDGKLDFDAFIKQYMVDDMGILGILKKGIIPRGYLVRTDPQIIDIQPSS